MTGQDAVKIARGFHESVGLTGVTLAEYFRDEGRDVLLFIDNIFRFTQAGSEVSALLGRLPSAVGYQPTLANEMGQLQERITSTKRGSITSLQAIFVPADDYMGLGLGGAIVVAGLAFVPIVGYVELVAVPAVGMRLRHRAGKRYAGLRTLARD